MIKTDNKSRKTAKSNKRIKKKEFNKEIIGIIIISLGILSLVSLYSQSTGYIGEVIHNRLMELAGFGGYVIPFVTLTIGVLFIVNKLHIEENRRSISILLLFIVFLTFLDIKYLDPTQYTDASPNLSLLDKIEIGLEWGRDNHVGGGIIGAIFSFLFLNMFGIIGSYIILFSLGLISFLVLTNVSLLNMLQYLTNIIINGIKISANSIKDFVYIEKSQNTPSKNENLYSEESIKSVFDDSISSEASKVKSELEQKIKILDYTKNSPIDIESKSTRKEDINIEENKQDKVGDFAIETIDAFTPHVMLEYKFPSLNLLKEIEKDNSTGNRKEILSNAKKLEETLLNFGIEAKIVQISKGPTITRYELQPAPGVKVSRIVGLSDDIALSLAASGIRIEAPIPGKAAVGIEVPNKSKVSVSLKDVLSSKEYTELDTKLPFALGKDIAGNPIITNIEKMPHLLIAGATGSGKSVCINTLIMSILYKSRPDEVKLLMIDPKVVELSVYNGIPHLLIPVVTDPNKAAGALNWAVQEMTKRYNLFAQSGVRDLTSFNKKTTDDSDIEKLPQIVIIIDELADLMMVSPTEVEDSICRLAQMARAAGIHLIVATQRPSVDIITGTIKANIPSRISFAVSSQIDSRTILDMGGAEKLLGKGDMLFYPVGESKPLRIQGAYIDEKEVEGIVGFLKTQGNADYKDEIISDIEKEANLDMDNGDELLSKAIDLVVHEGQASISLLQRRLRIGYARAARLIDEMEERGVVGGYEGSKPRKVLLSKEDLDL